MSEERENIIANSLTIEEFLNDGNIINIPRYQRGYSWEIKNIDTLLADVRIDYYLGNVIIYENQGIKEIVDGQQRIITLFLILIAIRNTTDDKKLREEIEKMIIFQDKCKLEIKDRIGADGSNILSLILDADEKKLKTWKMYNEVKSYLDIKKKISLLDLNELANKILQSRIVEIVFTKKEISAHEMFVNVNTKGKPLNPIEVIKSQLFKYLVEDPHSDHYKESWHKMLKGIPEKDYDSYVNDSYLFYVFENTERGAKIKTTGTVKENYLLFLEMIDNQTKAKRVFDMMTGSDAEDLFRVFSAIKNHKIEDLKDNYFSNKMEHVSLSEVGKLWKMIGEYGFQQSDIMFESLLMDHETFLTNIGYFKAFMEYIFGFELSRSILTNSPANYSNRFKQAAFLIRKEKDTNKLKSILKEFIKDLEIDEKRFKEELSQPSRFEKNYKGAKFIIQFAEDNYNTNLKIEHFIPQKTTIEKDKIHIGKLGNLIPVSSDQYKDKSVIEKLKQYEENLTDTGIRNFMDCDFTEENYSTQIDQRTNSIVEKFIKKMGMLKKIINEGE